MPMVQVMMGEVDENGKVELEVVGNLKSGRYFYGSDTVRIKKRTASGAVGTKPPE